MHANPSALDTHSLVACLRKSAGEERHRQVDFLLYLDPFDARGAYREAGYGSLWQFCLRELALREGAAGRRIGAMRVLREFPRLESPLRDGRLSLTTAVTLRQVLTLENLDELVARAAHKTDEETRHLVATLQPRPAPREGIRRLPEPAPRLPEPCPRQPDVRPVAAGAPAPPVEAEPEPFALAAPMPPPMLPRLPGRPSLEPASADEWSLRVTIDRTLKEEIETLKCLLSHKIPGGDLGAVLREAVRCANLGARRRPVHLHLARRSPLRLPLAARARPRPARRPRRTIHGRQPSDSMPNPQWPARGGDLRQRAHGPDHGGGAADAPDG